MSQTRMGGLTAIASDLTQKRGKLVTRQGVYMWWRRRDHNGFPEKKRVLIKEGKVRESFDLDEVLAWYDRYMAMPWQGRKA